MIEPAGLALGIALLLVSRVLAAVQIPLFVFGHARLGRATGGVLLVRYAVAALLNGVEWKWIHNFDS